MPKKGLVYDHFYEYVKYGSWTSWANHVDKVDIDEIFKVCHYYAC